LPQPPSADARQPDRAPRVAIDAMGGDRGPEVTVAAALRCGDRAELTLVGDEARIRRAAGSRASTLTVHAATDVLAPTDSLAEVLRRRPDSSMRQCLRLLADGRVDGVVSAGDTAALMALSRLLLDMVPGIDRPAIAKLMAGMHGPFWMLDLGANLDCTAAHLHQFARMGTILSRHVTGTPAPRVALLNIGTEPHKGPEVLHDAAERIGGDGALNYVGYIEGNGLFSGLADVVVADGFAGNIALKSIEGAARMAGHLLRSWMDGLGPLQRFGLWLSRGRLDEVRHGLNPQRYNGASLVGLSGVVVKSHGSADVDGFQSAIEEAVLEVQGRIPTELAAQSAGPDGPSAP
jgi:phosphate acyltransferase